jgi:cytochrome b6-f complex iron-sulfur subunit
MPMPLLAAPLLGSWDYLGIGVAAAVAVVAAGVLAATSRRSGRREPVAVDRDVPPPGATSPRGITRRVVVERGALGLFVAALSGVVAASVDYVVGALDGRKGKIFTLGTPEDLRRSARSSGRPYYEPTGGFYVVAYPAGDLTRARSEYSPPVLEGMEHGFVALDQACTHLGCRVPWCPTSQWFECPCHGSRYNAVGEQRRGPAPRGLDRYRVTVVDGKLTVDTGAKYLGPPPGTDTTGQPAAGPHCF